MSKVYVHPVFADMTIFTDDRYIKGVLYQLASGLSPPDFKYDPSTQTLTYRDLSVKIDSNRVSSYQKFKSLINPAPPKVPETQTEENWKKLSQDTRTQLLLDYVKRLAPSFQDHRRLVSKLILWSDLGSFSADDIVWDDPPVTRIKDISRVSFDGKDLKIAHRAVTKTAKNTRVTNPFRTHVEKYINSISSS